LKSANKGFKFQEKFHSKAEFDRTLLPNDSSLGVGVAEPAPDLVPSSESAFTQAQHSRLAGIGARRHAVACAEQAVEVVNVGDAAAFGDFA
jgi:hypothetical protein